MKRRDFLLQTSGLLTLTAASSLRIARALELNGNYPDAKSDQSGLSAQQWTTISAVQEHLLPHEDDSPGARDVNAESYLRWVLSAADTHRDTIELVSEGIAALESLSISQTTKRFTQLDETRAEHVLRQFEQTGLGKRWLRTILEFVLEALLADPVYGGNPEGIGWQWLGHQPGHKRPTADKRYMDLLKL